MLGEVPFSSRRRWSAVSLADGTFYLGAPGRIPVGTLAAVAEERQRQGRRVLALARAEGSLPDPPQEQPPTDLQPLGVVVLAEELRPNVRDTIAFLRREGVEVKVLSGDAPQTVAAIARDVGIVVGGVSEGDAIPDDPAARRSFRDRRDGGRAHLAGGQESDRRGACAPRAATWRWSETASTTCPR